MFRVTAEWIKRYQSGSGGWNREQLKQIGVVWPPVHGWIYRAEGKEISDQARERFESLKGMNKAARRAEKQPCLFDLPEGAAEHLRDID